MKKILQFILKIIAKGVLLRNKPDVIGITGSIGKTSAKEAVFLVLSKKFRTRQNFKNYNNEIGLPLTIIGEKSPGSSIFGWIKVFWQGILLAARKDKSYPDVLILEMGVDHPGDMDYFNSFIKLSAGVVTAIGESHMEFFGTVENIYKEKIKIFDSLDQDGFVILNIDEVKLKNFANKTNKKIITYGTTDAIVSAKEIKFLKTKDNIFGMNFKLVYSGSFVPVFLSGSIGMPVVYSALVGAAVGIIKGLNLVDVSQELSKYKLPQGRLAVLEGIKNSILIDDTYNSSPKAVAAAIEASNYLDNYNRKIAVLGDMLELGEKSSEEHKKIGDKLASGKFNILISVGEATKETAREAQKNNIINYHFDNSEKAAEFLKDFIQENDLLLIKGSQGMRMEKICARLLKNPELAKDLLVRQDNSWLN